MDKPIERSQTIETEKISMSFSDASAIGMSADQTIPPLSEMPEDEESEESLVTCILTIADWAKVF